MTNTRIIPLLFVLSFSSIFSGQLLAQKMCSYRTYQWSPSQNKAVNIRNIRHPYTELSALEIDSKSGCTVCEEDQQSIKLNQNLTIQMCKKMVPRIVPGLLKLLDQGEIITSLVGYRVGMTKGDLDANGLRTQFSNHSFGAAVDINSEFNGLYDNCHIFNSRCRLIKGGLWEPNQRESLTSESPIVKLLIRAGFKWGGEIEGQQKDFMHFSLTGY